MVNNRFNTAMTQRVLLSTLLMALLRLTTSESFPNSNDELKTGVKKSQTNNDTAELFFERENSGSLSKSGDELERSSDLVRHMRDRLPDTRHHSPGNLVTAALQKNINFCNPNSTKNKLWIAVFLPFPAQWRQYQVEKSRIRTLVADGNEWNGILSAQDTVNGNQDILKGYELCIDAIDTPCNTALAIQSLFSQMERRPDTLAVIGPNCYHVISTMAQAIQWWNVVEIAFNTNEGELANRRLFPTLVRTIPSLRAHFTALAEVVSHYNWTVVDVVHPDDPRCHEKYNQLLDVLNQRGIKVGANCVFDQRTADIDACGKVVNESRNNIKVFLGSGKDARKFFCKLFHTRSSARSKSNVWILTGNFDNGWWRDDDDNCTAREMTQAVSGHLLLDERSTVKNSSNQRIRQTWNSAVTSWAYDAIIAASSSLEIALTTNETKNATENEEIKITTSFRQSFIKSFQSVNATGQSGQVQFKDGERQSTIFLRQLQSSAYVTLASYAMMTKSLFVNESRIEWPGSCGPPLARAQTLLQINYLSPYIVSLIGTLSLLGIFLAFGFLAFNIRHRAVRIIKMSSPNLNNVIVAGCVIGYLSLILTGVETKYASSSIYDVLCKIRNWPPTCAFTLAFGTMFLKTWRVHAIFTNVTVKKKVISDFNLFSILGIFLLIDVVILTTWHVIDPMKRVVKNATDELWLEQGSFLVVYQDEFCQSNHAFIWVAMICIYKGVLLVFGLFLAWETRHVALSTLNDSKYIGASVYVTVIACVIGPTTSFALRDYWNLSYAISTLSILVCITATLCLVFVPKVTALRRMREKPDEFMNIRLQGLKRKNPTPKPVKTMLSMTIRAGPGIPRMLSETVDTSFDDKRSSSSLSNEANATASSQDAKVLRERLKAERRRLEKILEEKTTECMGNSITPVTCISNVDTTQPDYEKPEARI